MTFHIGVDVGGTFTDCVAITDAGHICHAKSLSTKADLTDGILHGLNGLAGELHVSIEELLGEAEHFSHGTTIGTNLVVERNGARVGLICSRGHRDSILMMRGAGRTAGKPVEQVYQPHDSRLPVPIVGRRSILEINERIDRNGDIVVQLDENAVRAEVAAWLHENAFDAVAICLLWSFRNTAHEMKVERIVRELTPAIFVSVSSQVAPCLGEYERTVATVINAYVGPGSSSYLDSLNNRLRQQGLRKPVLVMQSNGGVVPAVSVRSKPFTIIDSGPTGGLAGTAALAQAAGHAHVITTDMGGTSFDVGLILGGQPLIAGERTIDQYTYPLPHLDVRSIACGGGSIAMTDARTRSIRVGPESAGSDPGPACYGRGGTRPTVTDADVVLGLLRPQAFLGGQMPLDADASRRVVGDLAKSVGLSLEEAAAGIVRINNSNAALLIRQRTIEQGLDPRDFVLYAFGGAGPVHAFGFAAELGIREVIIPLGNGASTLSAYGIASADETRYFEAEYTVRPPLDPAELHAALARVETDARRILAADGVAILSIERTLLMRYVGQNLNSIAVPLAGAIIDSKTTAAIISDFERQYARLYGEGARVVFQSVEVFAIRLKIVSALGCKIVAQSQADSRWATATAATPVQHEVFWPLLMQRMSTAVVDGSSLTPQSIVNGPALVELPHTMVAVAPGQSLTPDRFGSLVLSL